MFIVYNDAKRLTLSGYSFPSDVVVSQMANSSSLLKERASNSLDKLDLQYLTPNGHHEFLSCIVESSRESAAKILLDGTLAISLRCDGRVDRTKSTSCM